MLRLDVELERGRFNLAAKLEAEAGVTGVFGRSGSGKSTLLGIIAGLIRPQRGRVVLDGEVLFDSQAGISVPVHRRRVGLVFQDSQLFPHYSVKGNLLYGQGRADSRFDDIVDLLALGPLLAARPRQLSGGERQRVALGRSLLASPRLLLLDEPLASLDQGLKEQILPFMKRVKEELGLPMLYVSHSLPEILQITDRLALVAAGRVVASGPLRDLVEGGLLGQGQVAAPDNILAVTVRCHDDEGGCTLGDCHGQRLVLPFQPCLAAGQTAYLSVNAGDIALARLPVAGTSIQNQLPGRVAAMEQRGAGVRVTIDAGVALVAEISPRACRELGLQVGEPVHCLVKARSFSYLTERFGGEDGNLPDRRGGSS